MPFATVLKTSCKEGENIMELRLAADNSIYGESVQHFSKRERNILKGILLALKGKINGLSYGDVVNTDAEPHCPEDARIIFHRKSGLLKWEPERVSLLNLRREKAKKIRFWDLRNKAVLNANVLDYLLKNTTRIPHEWECKKVVFLGTIYNSFYGVRCLYLDEDGIWKSYFHWLEKEPWHSNWGNDHYLAYLNY